MSRIDISDWKHFNLTDLFDVKGSKTTAKKDLILSENSELFPYITTSSLNNGVAGYSDFYTETGNVFTVDSATDGTVFFQEKNFSASDHVEKLIPKFNITKNIAIFLESILNINASIYEYGYTNKRSQEKLKKEKIVLPVDDSEFPDYQYMETYIDKVIETSEKKVKKISGMKNTSSININTVNWKRFHLYDEYLFDIDAGNKLDKNKMTELDPKINFVGRSNANNGVTGIVDVIEGAKIYEPGNMTISLGGEYLGACFIQDNFFYTSQNVNVLIPKRDMSLMTKMFISVMIFKEARTYYKAFDDELNRHIKTDFTVMLPILSDGGLNFKYMNDYMQRNYYKAEKNIKTILNLMQ